MRCHNLANAAATGIKSAWQKLTEPRGCLPSKASVYISIILLIILNVCFYYRNIRRAPANGDKKGPLQFASSLTRYPYELIIFLTYASYTWLSNAGVILFRTFLNNETRSKMWEGMDLFGGAGYETMFWIAYFVFLEGAEMWMGNKFVVGKYMTQKREKMLLPIVEEKEALLVQEEEDDEKKEVSIYEAIASTPVPTEVSDSEAAVPAPSRPSLWQRIRPYLVRKPVDLTAETVLGRYYMTAFFKCNLVFCFAMLANQTACSLNPEQYFDNKASEFPLMIAGCLMWTARATWLMMEGRNFAKAELDGRLEL